MNFLGCILARLFCRILYCRGCRVGGLTFGNFFDLVGDDFFDSVLGCTFAGVLTTS
jgi:hypothetical protein